MPQLTPQQFLESLGKRPLASVYLFDGPEDWLKGEALKALKETLFGKRPAENASFNWDRFQGKEAGAREILAACHTLPFMSEKRLVIVEQTQELPPKEALALADALPALPSSTCLTLLYSGTSSLRESLTASAQSAGHRVTFWPPFENQMPAWILSRAALRGKRLEGEALRLLHESFGGELAEIDQEIEKLTAFVGGRPVIGVQDVRELLLDQRSAPLIELEQAFWEGKVPRVLEVLKATYLEGKTPESFLYTFARIVRRLILAKSLQEEEKFPQEKIVERLGIRSFRMKRSLASALQHYPLRHLLEAHAHLLETEVSMKRGQIEPEVGITLWVCRWV